MIQVVRHVSQPRRSFYCPRIQVTSCFLGLEVVILTPNNAGVMALDVERLNALLVGVMRADRCLTDEEDAWTSLKF